jgi:hypothetical protein
MIRLIKATLVLIAKLAPQALAELNQGRKKKANHDDHEEQPNHDISLAVRIV